MITSRGIEAKQEKISMILNMKTPKTIRNIQSLNSKLTTMNHLPVKLVENSLPFFKILRDKT